MFKKCKNVETFYPKIYISLQVSMIIAGGYYRGFETMAISLSSLVIPGWTQNFQWSYLGYLPEERQWAPALGIANYVLKI